MKSNMQYESYSHLGDGCQHWLQMVLKVGLEAFLQAPKTHARATLLLVKTGQWHAAVVTTLCKTSR
jgi:hypothetical protein